MRSLRLICLGTALLLMLLAAGLWLYGNWPELTWRLLRWQMQFHRELGQLLRAASRDPQGTALSLIGASLAYGIFHAAGPGHGKVVLATYLATQPARLMQAVRLSVSAALLQALVAILLIGGAGWLFGLTGRQAQGAAVWLERGSFLLVALLGIWLAFRAGRGLYRQLRRPLPRRLGPVRQMARSAGHAAPRIGVAMPSFGASETCGCGHAHVPDSQRLNASHHWRERLGLLLSMGLRPCSGALLVLVLARVLNQFWLGVLATLGMAAGTAVTVTLLAVLSQRARHLSQRLLARRHPAADSLQLASQGVALLGGLLLCGLGISLMLAPTSLLLPR